MIDVRLSASAQTSLSALRSANNAADQAARTVATGREVNTAADSASRWALGRTMEAEASGYSAEARALALNQAATSIARTEAEGAAQNASFGIRGSIVEAAIASASGAELEARLTDALDEVETAVDEAADLGIKERALASEAAQKDDLEVALSSAVSSVLDADIEEAIVAQQQADVQRQLALRSQAIVNEVERRSVSMLF